MNPVHRCMMMDNQLSQTCDIHDVFACPDQLIYYSEASGTYGILIHDGGTSFITIQFCPWCGVALTHPPTASTDEIVVSELVVRSLPGDTSTPPAD